MARNVLAEVARHAADEGIPTFGLGRLYERQLAIADRLVPALPNAWRQVEQAPDLWT